MTAKDLISFEYPPLKTSDTGSRALSWMREFHVKHLPIVNNQQLLGLLSEEDILDFNHEKEPIGAHPLSLNRSYVKSNDHLFEVLRQLVDFKLSLIPVVDSEGDYMGIVTTESLLRYFANSSSFTEQGAIIVLEKSRRDYSLTEIANIVESEGVFILSSYVTSNPSSALVEVTLKLNVMDIGRILASFERYNYTVKASYQEGDYKEMLQDNYDALLNYLNI